MTNVNVNLCKKIVEDFFKNEEVKKHINVELYRNYSVKENIRYFISSNNNDSILNCTINSNFIISKYTHYYIKNYKDNKDYKNVYLNAVYHNDKKHLNFNTTCNKNDYNLKT